MARGASVHTVATADSLENEPWDFARDLLTNRSISPAPSLHARFTIRAAWPPSATSARTSSFISMSLTGVYRYGATWYSSSQLLQTRRRRRHAVPVLVSDHGFHGDRLRPLSAVGTPAGQASAVAWHRQYRRSSRHGRAACAQETSGSTAQHRVLDIAATVLTLLGVLPVGGMDAG